MAKKKSKGKTLSINDILEKSKLAKNKSKSKKSMPSLGQEASEEAVPTQVEITEIKDMVNLTNYKCSISAYELPSKEGWFFTLELLSEENSLYEIAGQRIYKSFQDAILDGFGAIEYLGFSLSTKSRAELSINAWDAENEEYTESFTYFDGLDFYKKPKTE